MAFKLIGGSCPVIKKVYGTDDEDFVRGEAVMFASGRLTKLTNGNDCAGVVTHNHTGGTDLYVEYILPTEDQEWEVAYTGTPDATFLVGMATADIDSSGLLINAADVIGGAFAVYSVDTTNTKCKIRIKERALS